MYMLAIHCTIHAIHNLLIFCSGISIQTEASSEPCLDPLVPGKHNIAIAPLEEDNVSEVSNLEAEMALSLQVQMAAMLAFAYIWSLGAFVPFRSVQTK